jgi:hypothetical protein
MSLVPESLPPERAAAARRPRPVFVTYLVLITAGIVAAIVIGLVRGADDAAAADAVERFVQAIEAQDGRAACNELSADTRAALESEEGSECEQALLSLQLSLGPVSEVKVAETSATVELSEGGSAYLEETSEGWRITAVGCEPRPDAPDECEVEA